MMAAPRRRKMLGQRRRVEDEGEDEGGPDHLDIDDDSMTDGSIISDDNENGHDSDTSNIDEASPVTPNVRKTAGNGAAKVAGRQPSSLATESTNKAVSDTEIMLHGLSITDQPAPVQEMQFDDVPTSPVETPAAPIVVSSNSVPRQPSEPLVERRRREHEEYKRRRDEDPAFVPNRGAFFMHDHRHAGPSANGFRPFNRGGRGRGRGAGVIGGPFAPMNQMHSPTDPLTSSPWAHDMHETVAEPMPPRQIRHAPDDEGPPNGNGIIPTCPPSANPINRTLSTEKRIGNVQVRVFLAGSKEPTVFSGVAFKQYTKLPDHRPPLRRDKPVRISLPDNPPRYVFPAVDRSFIFIPRAMRPNQQRVRGKPRSGLGSIGGFSRRTSVFGGSYYGGSAYSPSIALSRRSSLAPDGRDYMFSPTGSVVSRPPMPMENPRPVVRLPPTGRQDQQYPAYDGANAGEKPAQQGETSINDLPQPQTHPLPQKPSFQENRPSPLPMHQPRPQKAVSVADIESPALYQQPQPYQQAFHQQVPVQVSNGYPPDSHSRQPSYPSQRSTGTPLSQIPERAIHAAPFQPIAAYPQQQQNFYGHQPYQMMPPQQGFYYPGQYAGGAMAPSATAPAFVPASQQGQAQGFVQPAPVEQQARSQAAGQAAAGPNLVAQEVNGMVYYYDASQLPPMNSYPGYTNPPTYAAPGVVGMGGMVTPSPDAFYFQQPAPGMVYYSQ